MEFNEEKFQKAIKDANLGDSLAQYVQKIGDKRVSDGIKSYEDNRNKKDLNDSEKITNLEKELKEMKDSTAKNSLNNSIKESLKKAGLSEGFAKYIKVDNNDQSKIAEAVTGLKDDLLNAKQAEIDLKLKEGDIPQKGDITGPGSGMETAAREYAKKISDKK